MSAPATAPRRITLWIMSILLWLPRPAAASAPSQTYLGHQVVMGSVPVPMFGELDTRTDTYMIVRVTARADSMDWLMRSCRVKMSPVAGVKSSLPDTSVAKLPVEQMHLHRDVEGQWRGEWDSVWSEADVDGDGHPGVSIRVDVPLCAGHVYVATKSRTRAVAHRVGESILGELQVSMEQRVLGASNFCLRLGPRHQQQEFDGVFKLVPAPDDIICADVTDAAWPEVM